MLWRVPARGEELTHFGGGEGTWFGRCCRSGILNPHLRGKMRGTRICGGCGWVGDDLGAEDGAGWDLDVVGFL